VTYNRSRNGTGKAESPLKQPLERMSVLPQEVLEQPVVVLEIDAAVDPIIDIHIKEINIKPDKTW
jgi:hypothetical protein